MHTAGLGNLILHQKHSISIIYAKQQERIDICINWDLVEEKGKDLIKQADGSIYELQFSLQE